MQHKFYKRSCFDRRSTSDRRGRWQWFFKNRKTTADKRASDERRVLSEKRVGWERISKWSSTPYVNPYRYPYIYGVSNFGGDIYS